MNDKLYSLVKKSKENAQAMNQLINLFEPKLKKSLLLTKYELREDLEQELKCTLISYVLKYNIDSIPGFWDIKEQIENKKSETKADCKEKQPM